MFSLFNNNELLYIRVFCTVVVIKYIIIVVGFAHFYLCRFFQTQNLVKFLAALIHMLRELGMERGC